MDTGGLASLSACRSSTVACSIIVCTYLVASRPHSPSERRGACAPSSHPALFTLVRGIGILRTSPFGHSRKFTFILLRSYADTYPQPKPHQIAQLQGSCPMTTERGRGFLRGVPALWRR